MRITIFGVGRSGTKAIQLYLSYLVAQRENRIWINYEPYFWETRCTDVINNEGYYHHMHSPHFVQSEGEFTKRHVNFLKKLKISEMSSTTTFIRGNGRMDAINQVLQPDHNVVIIRDLYQVLVSVLKTEWDFWSVGFEHTQNWEAFIKEVRKKNLVEKYDWCLDQISDRLDQNAFYWYVMNKSVLQSSWPNTCFFQYSEIKIIEDLARHILDPTIDSPIDSDIFTGDFIHENYPLTSNLTNKSLTSKINSFLYQSNLMNKYGLYIPSKTHGSEARINTYYQKIQSSKVEGSKITIAKKDFFEFINEDISGMFEKIKWKKEAKLVT